jgi:hypothetical protein
LRIARAEQLASAARQQILVFVTAAAIQHRVSLSQMSRSSAFREPDLFPFGRIPVSRNLALLRVLSTIVPAEYAYVVRALNNIGLGGRQSTGKG